MAIIATIKLESGFSSKFKTNIINEVTRKISRKKTSIETKIKDRIKTAVKNALVATPEYQSLISGKLRAELGIPEADFRIIQVIDTWVNNIVVILKSGVKPLLLIEIGVIQSDYGDVLGLAAATYTYTGKRGHGEIPWLEWLLLEGDKRIVNRYEFSSNIKRGSRTGMGIMISKKRGFWQVPPEFAGTSVDNFATRALGNIGNTIDKIVEQVIKESLA